jgi:hypothetical protein
MNYSLDLDNPQTLDDVVAYCEFRKDTTVWSQLADKVKVRDYVKEKGLECILPKLYGTWNNANEIDFNSLPQSFVIKTNNASATNIIVRNKSNINENAIREQLGEWLKIDYGYETAQPHYSNIAPKILAEELLNDIESTANNKPLKDFKFWCVNGKPMFVIVYSDREENTHRFKCTCYDMSWKMHQEYLKPTAVHGPAIEKPICFDQMKDIASVLSSGFPFVRVDLYVINDMPIFGEMTFTPGLDSISYKFSQKLGELIGFQK